MATPYMGMITAVAFKAAPINWMLCDGSLLPIAQNTALFALIGTTYGGDGQTTFAIPDLRGRVPIHQGQGPGLPNYTLGDAAGAESVGLVSSNAGHSHTLMAAAKPPTPPTPEPVLTSDPSPARALLEVVDTRVLAYADGPADVVFDMGAMWDAGNSQAHENRQPFQVINFIICVEGIFPSRP